MRHSYFGRKLKRNTNERKGLIRNLVRSLIRHGNITTTLAKAKAIQGEIDGLVTKAKQDTRASGNELQKKLPGNSETALLREWAKTRFAPRASGYTKIVKIGTRRGDRAQQAILTFVDPLPERTVKKESTAKGTAAVKESAKAQSPVRNVAEPVKQKRTAKSRTK